MDSKSISRGSSPWCRANSQVAQEAEQLFVRMCTVRPKRKQTKDTVGSIPVLTTKGIGALTSLFLIERNHGVAELVDASRRKCKSHRLSAVYLLSRSRYEG